MMLLRFGLIALLLSPLATTLSAAPGDDLRTLLEQLPPKEMDEVIWLARCIYSETNRPYEQRLVAWAVRNRVDTQYRGETYRDVVLEPLQFSAFNSNSPRRAYLLSLNQTTTADAWRQALSIAYQVYRGNETDRPFSIRTRHFYSPISMKGGKTPPWAVRATPLDSEELGVDPKRFLFFESIDESQDPFIIANLGAGERIQEFQEAARPAQRTRRSGSLRDRVRPSGRVLRPARPGTRSASRPRR